MAAPRGGDALDLVALYVRRLGLLGSLEAPGVRWGVTVTKKSDSWVVRVNSGRQQTLYLVGDSSGAWAVALFFAGDAPPSVRDAAAERSPQTASGRVSQWVTYVDLDTARDLLDDPTVQSVARLLVDAVDQKLLQSNWSQRVVLEEVLRRARLL